MHKVEACVVEEGCRVLGYRGDGPALLAEGFGCVREERVKVKSKWYLLFITCACAQLIVAKPRSRGGRMRTVAPRCSCCSSLLLLLLPLPPLFLLVLLYCESAVAAVAVYV